MTHTRNLQSKPPESIPLEELVCPHCSTPFPDDLMVCDQCDTEAVQRKGIVSFSPSDERSSTCLPKAELGEFARKVETQSIRSAANEILAESPHGDAVLSAVFDVQRDLWQPLVAEHITGRCLDVNAEYGRRSMVLAEQTDSVYAVEPSLEKLRVASGRDDYASAERVTPIHSTDDQLPFREGSFQTIFADFTGEPVDQSRVERIGHYLSDDGSLLFLADGWPSRMGLTQLLGSEGTDSTSSRSLRPGTASDYRSLAGDAGFEEISIYVLFPSASRPLYAFNVENEHAIPTIFDTYANERGALGTVAKKLMTIANWSGMAKRCFPSFLVVCSSEPRRSTFRFDNPLVVAGRARSIVLDVHDTGISEIHKVPNRSSHEPFTERENLVTSVLSRADTPVAATIPDGKSLQSPFGSVRRITPADGRPLIEATGRDTDSMERVLNIGYEWLAEFQQTFGGELVDKSPAEVQKELQFAPADITPPAIDTPVTTFSTPVHGDFLPSNIYYDGRSITSVIDWEYGMLAGSPIIDAGHLLLNTTAWLVGDFEERVRTILCGTTEAAKRARACVRRYCDSVNLPYRTFEVYLPLAFLHKLVVNWQYDSVGTYTTLTDDQRMRVRTLIEAVEEMKIADQ